MSRGLTAGQKTALGAGSVEAYHLVRFDFASALYYTTAPYDITYLSQTYLSNAILGKIPDFKESLDIKPNTVNIELGGASIAAQALGLGNYVGVPVYIYLHIPSTADTVLIWQGEITNVAISEDAMDGTSKVKFKVANQWWNWDHKNARLLSDDYQQELFTGDVGLEFFGITEYKLEYWGKYQAIRGKVFSGLLEIYTDRAIEDFATTVAEGDDFERLSVPVLYGQRIMEGVPVYRGLGGNWLEYLDIVYVLAEGECDSLIDITFDGVSYTADTIAPYIEVTFHSGTDTQAADTNLVARQTDWTSSHQLKGLCYVYIRYDAAGNWNGEEPLPVFELKGRKCFDPRTSTTIFTTNPAVILRDYLSNTRIGKGLPTTLFSGVNDAANYCDALETPFSGGTQIERLKFEGFLRTGDTLKKNVEAILFAMRGYLPWANGLYHFTIERHDDTAIYTFDEDNISGAFEISHDNRLNEIHYKYIEPTFEHGENIIVVKSATYLTADNNKILKKSYTNRYESNQYRAENRASTIMKMSRESIRLKVNAAKMDALDLIPGDLVQVTRVSQGWTNKLFRVHEVKIDASGRLQFKLAEYEATAVTWAVGVEVTLPTNTDLVNPLVVDKPRDLRVVSGADVMMATSIDDATRNRMLVSWKPPLDMSGVLGFLLEYKESTDVEYINVPVVDWVTLALFDAYENAVPYSENLVADTGSVTLGRWRKYDCHLEAERGIDSEGNNTMWLINDWPTTTLHGIYYDDFNYYTPLTIANTKFSWAFEIRAAGKNYCFAGFNTLGGTILYAYIDLTNGTAPTTSLGVGGTVTVEDKGGGLYRVVFENLDNGSGTSNRLIRIYPANGTTIGDESYLGSAAEQGIIVGRVQLNEGATISPYAFTAGARRDWDPTDENLLYKSAEQDYGWWEASQVTIGANSTNDSDGNLKAEALTETATTLPHRVQMYVSDISRSEYKASTQWPRANILLGTRWSFAVELKAGAVRNYGHIYLELYDQYIFATIDLTTGAVAATRYDGTRYLNLYTDETVRAESKGSGWYRLILENIFVGNDFTVGEQVWFGFGPANCNTPTTSSCITYAGSTSGIAVYCSKAQLCEGATILDYVETNFVLDYGGRNEGVFIDDVVYGMEYDVRVSAINGIGVKSPWLTGTHVVAGEPTTGHETLVAGTDAMHNDSFFWHDDWRTLDAYTTVQASVGTVGGLRLTGHATLTAYAYKIWDNALQSLTHWDTNVKGKWHIKINTPANLTAGRYVHCAIGTSNMVGFYLDWNGSFIRVYGSVYRGATWYNTLLTSFHSSGNEIELEFEYVVGQHVRWWVDGTAYKRTTNIPLSTDTLNRVMAYMVLSANTAGTTVDVGEIMSFKDSVAG